VCLLFIYISAAIFSDLSHSVFLLIKYSSLLKYLLEVEICVLTKCLSEKFQLYLVDDFIIKYNLWIRDFIIKSYNLN
jgi:hypothetical protein